MAQSVMFVGMAVFSVGWILMGADAIRRDRVPAVPRLPDREVATTAPHCLRLRDTRGGVVLDGRDPKR